MDIKICGLQRLEDIKVINQYPEIRYAGFIFAKNSKRFVTPEQAKQLRAALRPDIKAVGVYTHTPIDEINEIGMFAGLSIAQLHSEETDEDCKQSDLPVWKMIPVKSADSLAKMESYPHAKGFLLDTYHKKLLGGTGMAFSWEAAKGISEKQFIILAGGLTPENIALAAKIVKPQVLDVNSGVETNGYKDALKIKELIRRYRNEF